MNWVDGAIILILLFFSLEAVGRNFISEFLDFLSFLLAFFLSLRFYNDVGNFYQNSFQIPHSLSNVLGFLTAWFLIETLFFTLTHLFVSKFPHVQKYNKYLNHFSVIPAFFRGLIFIAIILVLIASFPIQPKIKSAVEDSKVGSLILSEAHQLESPLKNVFGGITQDTLTFLTIKPKSEETVKLGFQTQDFKPSETLETKMVDLVNKERTSRGFKALIYDEKLRAIARPHSGDMLKRGYFSHFSPEGKNVANRAEEQGYKFSVIGENLAYAPTLDLAHNGLMNSPGHRANILAPDYNKLGIGIMDGGVYGLMITQVFSD